jgi:hypothetical protein
MPRKQIAPSRSLRGASLSHGRLRRSLLMIEPVTAGASSFRETQGASRELFVGLADNWLERYVGIEQYQSTSCADMCLLVGDRVYYLSIL